MRQLPQTVPDASRGVRVVAASSLEHLCPHRPERDAGTVTVAWVVTEVTIELHSLAGYFRTWADVAISHEEITRVIRDDLRSLDVRDVQVSTAWTTAGMAIEVAS